MNEKSWLSPVFEVNLNRIEKPRDHGLSMVMDKGLTVESLGNHLDAAGEYIDQVKLSFGTPAFTKKSDIQTKIEMCKDHEILIYPGGTLFELAYQDGDVMKYFHLLQDIGFNAVEISAGIIDLPQSTRGRLIRKVSEIGFSVIAEVGKKDPNRQPSPETLAKQMQHDQESGADYIIVESRESGQGIGIYDENGNIRESFLETIVEKIPNSNSLIWESPKKKQQAYLIHRFGQNVNLGNIPIDEAVPLEALRHGFRGDTFSARSTRR